jgi:hypothetical protein
METPKRAMGIGNRKRAAALALAVAMMLSMAPAGEAGDGDAAAGEAPGSGSAYGTMADGEAGYIQVTKKMLEMAGEEPADNKFRLFDEYAGMTGYPPDGSAGNIAKPSVDPAATSNDNVWRTPGASFYADGNNAASLKFGESSEYFIEKVWIFDGPAYCPSTYTLDGSAPYEAQGGAIEVYAADGALLGSYAAQNANAWALIDLASPESPQGYRASGLRFVKTSGSEPGTDSMYSWASEQYGVFSKIYYCDVAIAEVLLYGTKAEGSGEDYADDDPWRLEDHKAPEGTPVTGGQGLSFRDFVGTNSFFTENQATYEPLGTLREYHNWGWTEWTAGDQADGNGQKDSSAASMSPQATFINSWGSFDGYYKSLFDKGITAAICMQGGAIGASSRPSYQDPGGESTKPSSYLAHAQSMFQLAARYGGNKDIDPGLVRVAAGTAKQIGLGYVEYFENYNEPNLGAFSGAQFAAMTSADYDGHMGTMGPGVGVKQADPGAKLVLGGLAGIIYDTPYSGRDWTCLQFVSDMMKWFDANRTEEQWMAAHGGSLEGYAKYPFDVLNGHYYCPDGNAASGLSPEADHLYERIGDFVRFRDEYFPDKEIWLSEFGWDSAQGSPQSATVSATVNAGLTGPEVQGRWLVREYLLLAAAGIDRAQQFMMPDTSGNPDNPGRFATCGMVYGTQGSVDFKPSWYYVNTMSGALGGAALDRVEVVEDGGHAQSGGGAGDVETSGPWVLKFEYEDSSDIAYALWLPTSLGDQGGANAQGYELELPEGMESATLVALRDKAKWGARSDATGMIEGGKLRVEISEKPVFVIFSEDEYSNPFERSFEPKPSVEEYTFLFDNDFEGADADGDGVYGSAYSTYGADAAAVEDRNADGTQGKVLKMAGATASPEFRIPASAIGSFEYDTWYYVDYKIMAEDSNSAPKLALLDSWTPIYSNSGGGNRFKPQWSGDGDRATLDPGEWHQIKAKIRIDSATNYVSYEIFYDGRQLGAATMNADGARNYLPLGGLMLQMIADPGTGRSTYYYDDVWVYTPIPRDEILDGSFDGLDAGKTFASGDCGFSLPSDGSYTQTAAIVQPEPSDAFYLGEADRLLKVSQDLYFLNTASPAALGEIRAGQPYVFEFSFFATSAGTSPTLQLLYNGWMRHAVANTDWNGGMEVRTTGLDERGPSAFIKPEAGKWHRVAVRYEFESATKLAYSFYYDDMDEPVASLRLDSSVGDRSKPNSADDPTRQMEFISDTLSGTMGFLAGVTQKGASEGYAVYFNDVLLYRGDAVKEWPAKYAGGGEDPEDPDDPDDPEQPADKRLLASLLDNAAAIEADVFDEASRGAYLAALAAAAAALEDQDAAQATVDLAAAALGEAIGGLALPDGSDSALEELIGLLIEAAGLDGGLYTDGTWAALRSAVAEAWEYVAENYGGTGAPGAAGAAYGTAGVAGVAGAAGAAAIAADGDGQPLEALADVPPKILELIDALRRALRGLERKPADGGAAAPKKMGGGVYAESADVSLIAEDIQAGAAPELKFEVRGSDLEDVGMISLRLSARLADLDPASAAEGGAVSFELPPGLIGKAVILVNPGGDENPVPPIGEGYETYSVIIYANPGTTLDISGAVLEVAVKAAAGAGAEAKIVSLLLSHLDISYWDGGEPFGADASISPAVASVALRVASKYDINLDGLVTLVDVDYVRHYLGMGASSPEWASPLVARCDINRDGEVDIADLTLAIAKYESLVP